MSQRLIIITHISVVFNTTMSARLENRKILNKSLSKIIIKNNIIEKSVMKLPKYHTNLRGKSEKEVRLFIAKVNKLQ